MPATVAPRKLRVVRYTSAGRHRGEQVRVVQRRQPVAVRAQHLAGDERRHHRDRDERQPALERPGRRMRESSAMGSARSAKSTSAMPTMTRPDVRRAHRYTTAPTVAAAIAAPMRNQLAGQHERAGRGRARAASAPTSDVAAVARPARRAAR